MATVALVQGLVLWLSPSLLSKEEKCKRSQKFATENGFPVLDNVLLPKTKGFWACLDTLRGSLDAVYDLTIAYKNNCPNFLDNVFGVDPSEVHIHIQRIPLSKIPESEDGAAAWLLDAFERKDQLLTDFSACGHFPDEGTEGELSTINCILNYFVVLAVTMLFIYLAFVSIWVRIYVVLSCAYLALATYFNFRPSPILGIVKAVLYRERSKKLM